MSKMGKATESTPLEQLMDLEKAGGKGKEHNRTAFPEVISDGWVVAPINKQKKGFEKVVTNHETKVMVVPDDESAYGFATRVHEQGHLAMTPPKEGLMQWGAKSGIPPAILNAFEDGRINAHLQRDVDGYKEALREIPFPVDLGLLEQQIEEAVDQLGGDPELIHEFENEMRVTTAAMMAALMQHRVHSPEEWLRLADLGFLNEEQAELVTDFVTALPEMSFEDMVAHMQELFELLYEEQGEEQLVEAPVEGLGQGNGEENGEGEETKPGVGGDGPSPGVDREEEKPSEEVYQDVSKASTVEQKVTTPIEKPKPIFTQTKRVESKMPSSVARTLTSSGYKAAGIRPELWGGKARGSTWSPMTSYTRPGGGSFWTPHSGPSRSLGETVSTHGHEVADEDITVPHYGVSVQEENYLAEAMGGGRSEKFERGDMVLIDDFELTEKAANPAGTPNKGAKQDRVGYMTNPVRARIDGRVFRRKRRSTKQKPAGAVLLDLSGSMSPSSKMLVKALEIAPYAVIGAYAGSDRGNGHFAVVAQNGLAVSTETLQQLIERMGGGNSVDFQALEWLAEQPKPRVWCSDGFICGTASDVGEHVHRAFQLCREKEIIRVHQLSQLVGFQPLKNNLREVVR